MRLSFIAAACAALALPSAAQAQVGNIQGASLAGLCAASMEFVGATRAAKGVAKADELQMLAQTRDMFLAIPKFDPADINSYAAAWSKKMGEDLTAAPTLAGKEKVVAEIGFIARDCRQQLIDQIRAAQAGQTAPAPIPQAPAQVVIQPQPLESVPLDTQPLTVQPLTTQPYTVQPLDTQPLELQPIIINPQ